MFWMPLTRLGAFFVAVVIAGNVFFHAFRSAAASMPQDPQGSVDYFSRKGKRLRRQFFRVLERFLETPASASSIGDEQMGAGVSGPILGRITGSEGGGTLPAEPSIGRPGVPDPEAELFVWPALLKVPAEPVPILPKALGFTEWADFRAELVTDVYRRFGGDPLGDVGDALLKGPEMLFDGVVTCLGSLSGRCAVRTWEDDENRTVIEHLLDIQSGPRHQRIVAVFMQQWIEREQKYLGAFDESRANTYGFQDRTEGADLGELVNDQRKVILDVLRRTYLARYKTQSEEQIREEAWYFGRWSGMDFVVLPPLIGAYLYYRGLNKKIPMGDLALRFSFEPATEFIHRKHDRSVATALELTVKGFPVGIIVSAGLHDGRYGMDFVGIGTSIATVRRAVEMQHEDVRR
jgi:hypothetical protein